MRVLQIIDGERLGGITTLISDITNNIKDIDFDYLTSNNLIDGWYNLGVSRKSLFGKIIFNHRLRKFLKNNHYDIVHINSAVFLYSFQVVVICKLAGIKHIVVHSHSVPKYSILKKIIIKLLSPIYNKLIDIHLTCSELASKSLYTKKEKTVFVNNGICIDKFKYDSKIRKQYRKELGVEDKKVYGCVGAFDKNKNQLFLIDLFNEIKSDESKLILVGDGLFRDKIERKIKDLKLDDKVILLGYRDDLNCILNAFDIFLFPSFSEGLGISLIEAQVNGLPVVVSKEIPKEAKISKSFYRVNDYTISEWKKVISKIEFPNRLVAYKNGYKYGYDIKDVSSQIRKIYDDLTK